MPTRTKQLSPKSCSPLSTVPAILDVIAGTNGPIDVLKFSSTVDSAAIWSFDATDYASGNLTLKINWYADTASTGDVMWGGAIYCITPNTDTSDTETKAWAAETTFTDNHLGTTGQRLHTCDVTISNLDSIAAGDQVWIRVRRLGSNGADTMAGLAHLALAQVSYTT